MANWQRTLRLQPEWGQAQDGEITLQQLAKVVAFRLRSLRPFGDDVGRTILSFDDEREEIADNFEDIAGDDTATTDDFDDVMCALYDWADQHMDDKWNGKKVCWIDTTSRPASTPVDAGAT